MLIENDEKVIEALVTLLESNIGYGIDLFGLLSLYQLEDGRFSVNRFVYDSETREFLHDFEELFENARQAVEFFEKKRQEYEVGFDIESKLNKETGLI